jgi:hypothetical protein
LIEIKEADKNKPFFVLLAREKTKYLGVLFFVQQYFGKREVFLEIHRRDRYLVILRGKL